MKINPNLKKINTIFYNNLCIIALVFVVLCFSSCIDCLQNVKPISSSYNIKNGQIIGPIKVTKKPVVYQLEAIFYGNNSALDFSAEVLDSNKDTLYGLSYVVIAPEHPAVAELTKPEQKQAVEMKASL